MIEMDALHEAHSNATLFCVRTSCGRTMCRTPQEGQQTLLPLISINSKDAARLFVPH